MVEVNRQTLSEGKPVILKWSGSPYVDADSKYALNPAWKLPEQMDKFFTRIDEKTSIMKDSTLIQMDSLDLAIEYLRTEMDLQDIRRLGETYTPDAAYTKGEQIQDITEFNESKPYFHRNSLHATRTVAFTEVPKTFLDENIEKEDFLEKSGALYMNQLGVAVEKQGMFAINNPARPNGRSSMDSFDGIFQQLKTIDADYETGTDNPQGFGSSFNTKSGSIIRQFQEKIEEFINQNGNESYAKFYVSKQLYHALLREITTRETNLGDSVLFHKGNPYIFDVPIVKVDFLNAKSDPRKRNYWNHMALLADPASIAWGIFKGIESETSKQHRYLNYLTTWEVSFDTLLIWEQDALAFEVGQFQTGTFAISVSNTAKEAIEDATVEIYDPKSATPDTAIGTGTTGANGSVEIEDIGYGKYTVKVTAENYKDVVLEDVVLNEPIEIETVTMKRN